MLAAVRGPSGPCLNKQLAACKGCLRNVLVTYSAGERMEPKRHIGLRHPSRPHAPGSSDYFRYSLRDWGSSLLPCRLCFWIKLDSTIPCQSFSGRGAWL
ncbi:hypothetical protein TCAP_07413 [Tolypocladium capitatum]|uniref:Uncharacterized protein n=1 Tax=Tolypocladium capitatum TaxID=45235 RepID=A0A2K3PYN3_9HYPO|nr:hypothetical protein TCAP_07413 [Tolypocladium capitatum]